MSMALASGEPARRRYRLRRLLAEAGSVMLGVDNAPAIVEQLAERRVFVDSRPAAGLRISPHFFNTDEEIYEAMNVLASLIEK